MCQSRAQGGQRCAAHTRAEVNKTHQAYVRAAIERHICDVKVTSAESVARTTAEQARPGRPVPADAIDLDPDVCAARRARYDADEAAMRARRAHEDALVEHATTKTGRAEILDALATANDKGDLNGAARLQNVLLRADDTARARKGQRAVRTHDAPQRNRVPLYG